MAGSFSNAPIRSFYKIDVPNVSSARLLKFTVFPCDVCVAKKTTVSFKDRSEGFINYGGTSCRVKCVRLRYTYFIM